MPNIQKCVVGPEASMDALNAISNKALGYPQKGVHVGDGLHVAMPDTWDGEGATPPGWTSQAAANWVTAARDGALPITDELAAELQLPRNLARLSVAESATLLAAIAARVDIDLEEGLRVPKDAEKNSLAEPKV